MKKTNYIVTEIFDSIEGEGKRAGQLVTFIRLAGCNLRCSYCDTGYALEAKGNNMTAGEIADKVKYKRATITGGEPLTQELATLLIELFKRGVEVNIETNGSKDIRPYLNFPNVFFTIDFKCTSSGMSDKMLASNYLALRPRDVIKFVVSSSNDILQAEKYYELYKMSGKNVYLSPVFGAIKPATIVQVMQAHNLEGWRVQLQLHKFIWDPSKRGV